MLIANSDTNSAVMNITKLPRSSPYGMNSIDAAASAVPAMMKGMRLPSGVFVRSESAPKTGSSTSAKTLSIAMTTPDMVSPMPKLFLRISGIMLS